MNRDVRILFSALLIVAVVVFGWMAMILFRDFIPSERPIWEKVSLGVGVLANLTLVVALSHVLYTRRADLRFFIAFLTLFAIRILIESVFG